MKKLFIMLSIMGAIVLTSCGQSSKSVETKDSVFVDTISMIADSIQMDTVKVDSLQN